MKRKKPKNKPNPIARDLATPKYRARRVEDKRKKAEKRACRTPADPSQQ